MTLEVYILLKNRLSEIAEFKEIDWFTGQYDQSGEQELAVDAGCYIEFFPGDWQTLGAGQQQTVLLFDVHLVQDCVLVGDKRVLSNSLNHLALAQNIYTKLQGWGAMLSDISAFSGLAGTSEDVVIINEIVRMATTPDMRLKKIIVTVQRFSCLIRDVSASPQYQEISATLNLDVDV